MTNTRNQDVEKTLKDHDKAITDLQVTLAAMMKQQEQLMKQQEQMLKAFSENKSFASGSTSGKVIDGDQRMGNRPMRVGKVEFPWFNGENVAGWIYCCEHFFAIDDTPDNLKLRNTVIHLEGDAIEWHRSFMKTRGATVAELPWEDYVRAITARFSNAMFEDGMEEIASLTQTDSLKEYNNSFDGLLNKVTINETYAVSLYLKGLKPEIKGPVKMFKPQTLHEAYGLARIQNINNMSLINRLKADEDGSQHVKSGSEVGKITPPLNASKLPLLPSPTTGATEPLTSKAIALQEKVDSSGSGEADDKKRNIGFLEKLMDDNEKMMRLMNQMFERNEMQTRMLDSLSQRVEQPEKVFVCDNRKRKKKQFA